MGAIQWLVLCGAALVLAIALGTAYLAMQYRERAIKVAERDLTNGAAVVASFRPATDRSPACP
jgi:hypothetical protein